MFQKVSINKIFDLFNMILVMHCQNNIYIGFDVFRLNGNYVNNQHLESFKQP